MRFKGVSPIPQTASVIAGCVLASAVCSGQAVETGCRSLSNQVWYDAAPPRPFRSVGIVKVESRGGHTAVFATFGENVQRTLDYGEHWTPLNTRPAQHMPELLGKVAPSDPNILYKYETTGIIMRSGDGGKTWIKPSPKVGGKSAAETAFLMSGQHDYVLEFQITAIHPLKPLTIYATVDLGPRRTPHGDFRERYFLRGMYVSDDGGENWAQFSDRVGQFDKYPTSVVLGINPSFPDLMFSEGEDGILRSIDGGKTWTSVGQSDLLNLQSLDTEDRDAGVLVPKRVPLNPTEFVFDRDSAQVVYVLSMKGIHRSLDGGDSWTLLNLGFDRLHSVHNMAVDPLQTNRLLVGTDRGLFISDDRGCTFARMPTPEP
jgi:photosystem II stability/assembly factor-like uncharacterized protein